MSIRLEIDPSGRILATFDTYKDAVEFAKEYTKSNGTSHSPQPAAAQTAVTNERHGIAEAVSALRERQKEVLTAVVSNNGAIGDEALRTALSVNRSALGGLVAGISKSLALFGIDRKTVIDSRVSEQDGSIEYYIPARSVDDVRAGLTD
jgi:hypothetical protein